MTKLINYIIYCAGILLIFFFDYAHSSRDIIFLLFFMQCFSLYVQYLQSKRVFVGVVYIQSKYSTKIKHLLIAIIVAPLLYLLPFYFIAHNNISHWLALIAMLDCMLIVDFFLFRGKSTIFMVLEDKQLIINDVFIKKYDISQLKQIDFDGFYEKYYFIFDKGKKLVLKQNQFEGADENNIITAIVNAAGGDVLLTENLRHKQIPLQDNLNPSPGQGDPQFT